MIINLLIVKGLKVIKLFKKFRAEADAAFRRAVLTDVYNHIVYYNGSVQRVLVGLPCHIKQYILGCFIQKTKPFGILNIPAYIGYFIGKLYNAALPRYRLKLSGLLKRLGVYKFASWLYAVLVNLSAEGHYAVAYRIG